MGDEDSSHFDLEDEHDLIDEKNQDDIKSEEKKTLKEKLQAVQDVTALVQNALGYVAHLAEGVKNTFNFSVPFLSYLAIVVLLAIGVVLYYINLRYLLIIWGINKFSKKLIRPNYVPNNELLDFLSRVPDDEELIDYREMKLENESKCSCITDQKEPKCGTAPYRRWKKEEKVVKIFEIFVEFIQFCLYEEMHTINAQISSEFQIKNLYLLFIRFFQNHIQSILQI